MQIKGFSKLSKIGKLRWIVENFFKDPEAVMQELKSFWLEDESQQRVLDGFSENTISNFYLPYGVAPNFLINGVTHAVPMVIEESSVVAAASAGAKFWLTRGGFQATVLSSTKVGQVHFKWNGDISWWDDLTKQELRKQLLNDTATLTQNMEKRGGGIREIDIIKTDGVFHQIHATFDTCDSMGANFINSVLERFSITLEKFIQSQEQWPDSAQDCTIIMAILSNYTPDCIVRAEVSCQVEEMATGDMKGEEFVQRFLDAILIAQMDPYRAATHNKGIYNGVDAVVLATGNDFRAVEACGHTYASRAGRYSSLSNCSIEDGIFNFWLDLPIAVGTVGGLTKLHPIAKRSLELLKNPSAEQLMEIIAAVGLAQNFMAVRSLVTTGIQKGHMKLHLLNILNHLEANTEETKKAIEYFETKTISFANVREFIKKLRASS